ncbi:MAG: glutamate--tRNA ligase [Oligoflexia bacterium]|nr:glutamate--tRNA ligase [Oligoflexia bacterium]
MSCRVRFAPSPTGYLHIGGARTALYCYLWARACNGSFILRIEDTDQSRSKREFEESQINDLHWLGVDYDEGPGKGEYGPYRQSERLNIYSEYAKVLINKGNAYYCFCSETELERKKEALEKQNLAPHYDGTCRNLSLEEAIRRIEQGERAAIRFKAYKKAYSFRDLVRGEITFPEDMVGDFIILRSDGLPVYNYCCVIDDYLMKISHVIRAEEHLPNTLRQLMIYESFAVTPPFFGHVSLIVGEDRQKLSKRRGDTSVDYYRKEGVIPEALVNYLVQLGWSHPQEKDIYNIQELISVFSLDRFSKSPAVLDPAKLKWVNGQHLHLQNDDMVLAEVKKYIPENHQFYQQNNEWQLTAISLLKKQIELYREINHCLEWLFNPQVNFTPELKMILEHDATPKIVSYLQEVYKNIGTPPLPSEVENIITTVKEKFKIKGSPLFLGLRAAVTARAAGPDLKTMIALTPVDVVKSRLEQIHGFYAK